MKKQFPRTKAEHLKYVEALHSALERELVGDFHEDTVPQLKSQIRRLEDRLVRTPNGNQARKDAVEAARRMPDQLSVLVNAFKRIQG